MQNDLFCEDYYQPPDQKVIMMMQNLVAWKRQNLTLYPTDVMNMMIEHGFLTENDAEKIFSGVAEKSLDLRLPMCYIK